ncbi:hypothetical protein Glove_232g182 [Diversispora epigaea]|uniref:Uncharacterized protein n=1 Tax=Diversispora epigaea TaxID=1348612 RepID=A0A397IJP4_9GLOM|nr:hypothetical protein Glove_232g182 [Diversispora epigaea]
MIIKCGLVLELVIPPPPPILKSENFSIVQSFSAVTDISYCYRRQFDCYCLKMMLYEDVKVPPEETKLSEANFVKFIDPEEIQIEIIKLLYDEIEQKVHEAKSEEHHKLYMIML